MIYMNTEHIKQVGVDWDDLTGVIEEAVGALDKKDYAQPIKPYLRYGDPKNRIIAMPGYIGGANPLAGIKWIASFPDNVYKNKLRANSVTILNEFDTGIPKCIINTSFLSAIRTASVSGLVVRKYIGKDVRRSYSVGIIGLGPIGMMHLRMVESILGGNIGKIYLYDLKEIEVMYNGDKIVICDTWEECYANADIFITCTVSPDRYIDKEPKKGSLQLNVSLRDYKVDVRKYMDIIVVDDWQEVCRQNTDIEIMHKEMGLNQDDTVSLCEFMHGEYHPGSMADKTIMFNPMGMAVFDIAVGGYYYRKAIDHGIGIEIPD
jgi:ornithine cyclodeaminase